jgi:ketosteroid isomerase-like protein
VNAAEIAELLDKQAIAEGLYRYCRAMDRQDKSLVRRVFHDDVLAEYAPGHAIRSVEELITWMWEQHRPFHCHSHQVSNILIEVSGDTAGSESYVHTKLTRRKSAERLDLYTIMGRYIDRWERRNGSWKIAHRRFLGDIMDLREIDDLLPAGSSFAVRDLEDASKDPSYSVLDSRAIYIGVDS